jgi:hypothetical protein
MEESTRPPAILAGDQEREHARPLPARLPGEAVDLQIFNMFGTLTVLVPSATT